MYEYRAVVVDEYDADTIYVDLDMGKRVWLREEPIRLNRIDAYEIRGIERPLGLLAKAYMLTKIERGTYVCIRTEMDREEKYGRLLGDIYPVGFAGYCLNDLLVEQGHAFYWDGQGPRPR